MPVKHPLSNLIHAASSLIYDFAPSSDAKKFNQAAKFSSKVLVLSLEFDRREDFAGHFSAMTDFEKMNFIRSIDEVRAACNRLEMEAKKYLNASSENKSHKSVDGL